MNISASDFFLAETISSDVPVKMIGEWVSLGHPRDLNEGMIELQMVTHHPLLRVSSDGKLMSDESKATLELLPMRCHFNQDALRFVRDFFSFSGDCTAGDGKKE